MAVLAKQIFKRLNPSIPPDAQKLLCEQAEKYERSAAKLGDALTAYLKSAESRNIPTIVLKGLWLCEKIYHMPSMRPGGDIDLLVRRKDVDACLSLLAERGIDEFWPNLLKDEYFTRHHLHQQRSSADLNIWFEIHWAVTRQLMGRAADQELAACEGRATSRFRNLLLASNGAFILRPVRMLETLSYFFPPADFLRRRYSEATLATRARHFFTAFLQTLRFGWDTFYFGMERYFRLKRQGKSASLFNKLETHL
jgi:hypothetical protein